MSEVKKARAISAQEAAALVKSGDWLDYGFCLGQPDLFDRALADRAGDLQDVSIRASLSMKPRQVLERDPEGSAFQWFNWHFSGYDRKQHDLGRCTYIPMNFGEAPGYYRRFTPPIDLVCVKTAPPDAEGKFNLGCNTTYLKAMIEQARIVIVETCASMPRCLGPDNDLSADQVDFVIEGEGVALPQLPSAPQGEIERQVAARIAAEIEDGACLQIGIGGLPNAVCSLLRDANLKDLGVQTEMMVDGIADLIEAGIVTNSRKAAYSGRSVYSFAAGSQRLYRLLHDNPDFLALSVDLTNMPDLIARNDKVVAVNNTAEIDLQGQAASEAVGFRHVSGTGGQLQFVRGAYASNGGKSFLCLSSTYEKHGQRKSRVVPTLTLGSIVTTPRTDVMYVVTEYGIANLKGRSVAERAYAMIGLAHPEFREQLERDAYNLNLIPKGYRLRS
jgi:acyl-CoA hydrolase